MRQRSRVRYSKSRRERKRKSGIAVAVELPGAGGSFELRDLEQQRLGSVVTLEGSPRAAVPSRLPLLQQQTSSVYLRGQQRASHHARAYGYLPFSYRQRLLAPGSLARAHWLGGNASTWRATSGRIPASSLSRVLLSRLMVNCYM
jgi:hypothetical protein